MKTATLSGAQRSAAQRILRALTIVRARKIRVIRARDQGRRGVCLGGEVMLCLEVLHCVFWRRARPVVYFSSRAISLLRF